jgi:hypothetical protein
MDTDAHGQEPRSGVSSPAVMDFLPLKISAPRCSQQLNLSGWLRQAILRLVQQSRAEWPPENVV